MPSRQKGIMIIIAQEKTHWYTSEGEAKHSVVSKDGALRSTNLRDARKLGLYPSVTNVLGVMAKPQLTNYKIRNAIEAAYRLPKLANDTCDSWSYRVLEEADKPRDAAAGFGTLIHKAIEEFVVNHNSTTDPLLKPFMDHFERWFDGNILEVISAEKVLTSPLGYAGTCDLIAKNKEGLISIYDWKTQGFKGKPTFYDTWGLQLSAYAKCLPYPVSIVSVAIHSSEAQPVITQCWEDQDTLFGIFRMCLNMWKWKNKYEPNNKIEETQV